MSAGTDRDPVREAAGPGRAPESARVSVSVSDRARVSGQVQVSGPGSDRESAAPGQASDPAQDQGSGSAVRDLAPDQAQGRAAGGRAPEMVLSHSAR
ncbi:MAG TPA: hypothetical protein VHX59_04830 [Mycobacteriales bacterium]|nr:hypothetical protein [Mycobacteriales bacterium]